MAAVLAGDATPAQIGGLLIALRAKDVDRRGADRLRAGACSTPPSRVDARRRRHRHVRHGRLAQRREAAFNVSTVAGARRRRRGRQGVQARQPQGVGDERLGRPARGARRRRRPRARRRGPLRRGGGHRVLPRAPLPPGHAPSRAGAARARRAHRVQLPRPAGQPGAGASARSSAWPTAAMAEKLSRVLRGQRRRAGHGGVRPRRARRADDRDPSTVSSCATARSAATTSTPPTLGLTRGASSAPPGGDTAANVDLASAVLGGEPGPHRDIVVLNAAAALVVAGVVDDIADGVRGGGRVDRRRPGR